MKNKTSENLHSKVLKLLEIMRKLRSEEGCPWDREQSHVTLKPYLVEECAELLDAIDEADRNSIVEELGDVLLHIVFHSQIGVENGTFSFEDVVDVVSEKLIRRHPHVFADSLADNTEDVLRLWQEVKKKEKGGMEPESCLDGIPRHFPALHRAEEIQKRAAKKGFDWTSPVQIVEKIEEEVRELKESLAEGDKIKIEDEIGDVIFSAVNLARFLRGKSAEEIVATTTEKFKKRFRHIEKRLKEKGSSLEDSTLEEMDKLWDEAKKTP